MDSLALCYESQGRGKVAESLWRKAIQNDEKGLPQDSPDPASDFESPGQFCALHRQAAQAEPLLKSTLDIRMKALGPAALETRQTMHAYETTLRLLNRSPEAGKLEGRSNGRSKPRRTTPRPHATSIR